MVIDGLGRLRNNREGSWAETLLVPKRPSFDQAHPSSPNPDPRSHLIETRRGWQTPAIFARSRRSKESDTRQDDIQTAGSYFIDPAGVAKLYVHLDR